jgi:hypothetical protein
MRMVEIIVDFFLKMVEASQTHVRPICVLLLLNYISRETEIILAPQTHT